MGRLDATAMRYLSRDDFRVLTAVEMGMKNHEIVPVELIVSIAQLRHGGAHKILSTLLQYKLITHDRKKYDGYSLTYKGYDYLALRTFLVRGKVTGIGRKIGVGKESDVYMAVDGEGKELAIKFHRLGRISFRAIKRKRDYLKHRQNASWLYMSRLAALKEFAFMQVRQGVVVDLGGLFLPLPLPLSLPLPLPFFSFIVPLLFLYCSFPFPFFSFPFFSFLFLSFPFFFLSFPFILLSFPFLSLSFSFLFPLTVSCSCRCCAMQNSPVPEPVDYNRHAVVMSLVQAFPLTSVKELDSPGELFDNLMALAGRLASAGLVHADFNEFNLLVNAAGGITLIDFPQMVPLTHPDAEK